MFKNIIDLSTAELAYC